MRLGTLVDSLWPLTWCTMHLALFHADDSDVVDQPIRMRVRGSSSAVEYAKKSFSLDPVDQITNFTAAEKTNINLLGEYGPAC